jgi:Rod binding domain-containing protein
MASSSLTMDARRQQLQQQAASSGVHALPPLAVLPRPDACSLSAISHTPQDDSLAEDLLKRRRLNANPDKSQSSLRKAFTSSKQKAWAPKEIYDALDAHVANSGSPGVAEALIAKLTSTGASLSTPGNKPKANLLSRRKSMGAMSPLRILQKAVENHQTDMVAVLVRHADHFALDAALPIAIRSGDIAILRLLLQYGASASQTAECQDAFRQICIRGGQADIVGLILQSEGRPSPSYLSDCLIDATRKGCIDTVLRLSHSAADGTQREAAALKEAVAKCRVDITLAILTGTKPPTGRGLDETLGRLVAMNSIRPEDRLALAQALLNAGVSNAGAISEALVSVLHIEPLDLRLLDLLLEQGQADVNVKDGSAIVQGKWQPPLHYVCSMILTAVYIVARF